MSTTLTATDFRKNLFQTLDQAIHGERIQIVYKGSTLRLVAPANTSKLSRAVRRNALLVDPQAIVESDSELMAEVEAKLGKANNE